MYAIAGGTARTGSATAEALLALGHPTRVLIRDPSREAQLRARGFDVALADLEDAPAVTRALQGVRAAFMLVPPDLSTDDLIGSRMRLIDRFAEAFARSGVRQLVFLSGWGAHQPDCNGPVRYLHYGERRLGALDCALTVLRPGGFYENWANVLQVALQHGMLPTALTIERKIPMVGTRDIGQLAAQCLIEEAAARRVIELAGPEDYSPADVAQALSQLAGRPITPVMMGQDELIDTLMSFGISREVATQQSELVRAMNAGHYRWEGNGTEFVRAETSIQTGLGQMLAAAG